MSSLELSHEEKVKSLQEALEEEQDAKDCLSKELAEVKEKLAREVSTNLALEMEVEPLKQEVESQKAATSKARQETETYMRRLFEMESMGLTPRYQKVLQDKDAALLRTSDQIDTLIKRVRELEEVEAVRQENAENEAGRAAFDEWKFEQVKARLRFAEAELAKLPENPMFKFVTDPRKWNHAEPAENPIVYELPGCSHVPPREDEHSPRGLSSIQAKENTPESAGGAVGEWLQTQLDAPVPTRPSSLAATVTVRYSPDIKPEPRGPWGGKGKGKMMVSQLPIGTMLTPPETPIYHLPHGLF